MKQTAGQLLRYGIVGLITNIAIYIAYLAATAFGLGHKTAMSCLYLLGTVLGFTLNRNWSFGHQGNIRSSFPAYLLVYVAGYLVNYTGLVIFVDILGIDHRLIQGVLIIFVAMLLFLGQKYLVFRIS